MQKSLHIDPDKCTGCLQCEMACSYENYATFAPAKSRIKVFDFHATGRKVPYTCTQCDEAWCLHACPVDAITIDVMTGAKVVNVTVRDDAVLHLWSASDAAWTDRADLRERPICSGAESFLAGTASCRIEVADIDALFAELEPAGVLHPTVRSGVATTDFGTREFATLDADGNLLTFFHWEDA